MHAAEIWTDVEAIRSRNPLVHNITNYVVMNNTANALLALGASPVMAHAEEEMESLADLTKLVGGALVINIGTLSRSWIDAMAKAMRAAAARGIPVVLDPVGAGATAYRTDTCRTLLKAARPTVMRGNASEILALWHDGATTKGVDSVHGAEAAGEAARGLAERHACVVCVSGASDLITDGRNEVRVHNGVPMMTRVTGLGCTASALTGAFLAVQPSALRAAAQAMAVMGISGEVAAERAAGPGTLQTHFLDTLYNLDCVMIETRLRCA